MSIKVECVLIIRASGWGVLWKQEPWLRCPILLAVAAIYSNLKPSAKDLVHNVHKYMEEVLWKLIEDVAEAFPRLKAAMKALVTSSPCSRLVLPLLLCKLHV